MVSPSKLAFNYADSNSEDIYTAHGVFWVAHFFTQAEVFQNEINNGKVYGPYRLFWGYKSALYASDVRDMQLEVRFAGEGVETIFFRSSFEDSKATWLALKAGETSPNPIVRDHSYAHKCETQFCVV